MNRARRLASASWALSAAAGRLAWRAWLRATARPRAWGWSWWFYSREPLTAPAEALRGLALVGYRLQPGFRIARVRVGVRGLRAGLWVAVEPDRQPSRHWRVQHVRWIDDPIEYWLLRSALQRPG